MMMKKILFLFLGQVLTHPLKFAPVLRGEAKEDRTQVVEANEDTLDTESYNTDIKPSPDNKEQLS